MLYYSKQGLLLKRCDYLTNTSNYFNQNFCLQHGWDANEMFNTNQNRFGVASTYNPDMTGYTTPLNVDKSSDEYKQATRLAREIEATSQRGDPDEREEEE